jgi:hydrogenase expression/formation protein HypE
MSINPFLSSCPVPEFSFDKITLGHGSGGILTSQLLEKTVFNLFNNQALNHQHDGAIVTAAGRIAVSTDSYVVSPIFFPGGNIGDLAANGTLNDLAMCGARPKYLSLALIIEEGLSMEKLWIILNSIKTITDRHGVQVITGDTKVVESGKGDQIFINTTGIGEVPDGVFISATDINHGDCVILSGPVASHGMSIMSVRKGLEFRTGLRSDTCYVGEAALALTNKLGADLHFLRDPTRGGLATSLNELVNGTYYDIVLNESTIPVLPEARSACEMLGLDPLYVANEGIFIAVVSAGVEKAALDILQHFEVSTHAVCIGKVIKGGRGRVVVSSSLGGKRVAGKLTGDQLPRIC